MSLFIALTFWNIFLLPIYATFFVLLACNNAALLFHHSDLFDFGRKKRRLQTTRSSLSILFSVLIKVTSLLKCFFLLCLLSISSEFCLQSLRNSHLVILRDTVHWLNKFY